MIDPSRLTVFCAAVLGGGGDSILPAKDNQPTLVSDIAAAFASPPAGLSPPGRRRFVRRALTKFGP